MDWSLWMIPAIMAAIFAMYVFYSSLSGLIDSVRPIYVNHLPTSMAIQLSKQAQGETLVTVGFSLLLAAFCIWLSFY